MLLRAVLWSRDCLIIVLNLYISNHGEKGKSHSGPLELGSCHYDIWHNPFLLVSDGKASSGTVQEVMETTVKGS